LADAKPRSRHWLLILCYGAFGFGYVIPATFLPAMAKEVIADPVLFGWAWPVFGAAAAASTFIAGSFSNQRNAWIVATLLMAVGVVLPLVIPGFAGILIAAILVGATFMVITMAGMREARRVGAENARPLMAAMTSAFALGQIAGPLWVGYKSSVAQSLVAAAAVLVLSAAALFHNGVET
jgi:predicted MFS family arabinose efflux permease